MPTDPAARPHCPPERYRVLAVGGRDAAAFLQGQLTRDVLVLDAGATGLAALLTPQGRVIAAPWLARAGAGYALALPPELAEPVRARLARYVLRAKVSLTVEALSPALAALIAAAVGDHADDGPAAGADGRFALALVRAGLAEVGLAASEEWIPQMLNLDLVGAISFQKGCYTGQEIVARTQHLGRIKRRMFRLATAAPPPAVKAAVHADGHKVGEVVLAARTASGAECLAVLNLDARALPLALEDGAPCQLLPLPYALG